MKTNQEIRQIAEDLLYEHCEERTVDNVIDVMLLFAKQMCELQKQECADNAKIEQYHNLAKPVIEDDFWDGEWNYSVNKESILNTPNICENE